MALFYRRGRERKRVKEELRLSVLSTKTMQITLSKLFMGD